MQNEQLELVLQEMAQTDRLKREEELKQSVLHSQYEALLEKCELVLNRIRNRKIKDS